MITVPHIRAGGCNKSQVCSDLDQLSPSLNRTSSTHRKICKCEPWCSAQAKYATMLHKVWKTNNRAPMGARAGHVVASPKASARGDVIIRETYIAKIQPFAAEDSRFLL